MAVVCQGYSLEINLASSNISPKAVCKNCFSMLTHSVYLPGVRAAIPHGRLNNILICTFYFTHFFSLQLLEQDEFPQDTGLWLKGVNWFSSQQLIVLMFFPSLPGKHLSAFEIIYLLAFFPLLNCTENQIEGQCSPKWMSTWQQRPTGSYILSSSALEMYHLKSRELHNLCQFNH